MENKKPVPNIVIWSWMRTILDLSGSELLIFSYIFSQTFDSVHRCYTCQSDMEQWFGITRQTVSRNIDSLVEKGLVIKQCVRDGENIVIKHNNYRVDMNTITQLCESSEYSDYVNFIDCYRNLLQQRFPNDTTTIEDYLSSLLSYHKNKDMEITVTVNQLAELINSQPTEETQRITDVLEQLKKRDKNIKGFAEKSYIQKEVVTTPKQEPTLFTMPKKKSKRALRNEWYEEKKSMNHEFVYLRAGGNEELLNALNQFLETDNGLSYTPTQWSQQLEILHKYGRTTARMIEGINISFMNNYRQLYIPDKNEVDIDEKLHEIDTYVDEQCSGSEELRELLVSYIFDVPKGKSYTVKQFRLALKNLSIICPTLEEKLRSVELSYTNSYSSLAYPNNKYTTSTNSEKDVDDKLSQVDKFISDGYYYLCDGLSDLLKKYVTETTYGRSVSSNEFAIMLSNLRLLCLDDNEKVNKVSFAIQNNANKFATEDYNETQRIKSKYETRESVATTFDRSRKQRVIMEKRKHPNDPRLKNVVIPQTQNNVM